MKMTRMILLKFQLLRNLSTGIPLQSSKEGSCVVAAVGNPNRGKRETK